MLLDLIKEDILNKFDEDVNTNLLLSVIKKTESDVVRTSILKQKKNRWTR